MLADGQNSDAISAVQHPQVVADADHHGIVFLVKVQVACNQSFVLICSSIQRKATQSNSLQGVQGLHALRFLLANSSMPCP